MVEDASGLTSKEWDPTKHADDSQPSQKAFCDNDDGLERVIDSSELRGAGFNLLEVIPPALEAAERSGRHTRGARLRQIEGMGRKSFVLSGDDDNVVSSRGE